MSTPVLLPKIGFNMSEGVVVEWHATDGAAVKEGEPLYSLEAEKAVMEIEAPVSGSLRIVAQAGETQPVGTVLAYIE